MFVTLLDGRIAKVWCYDDKYGFGCGECCNKDRECECDHYYRPECPYCQGKGWITDEMLKHFN